MRTAIALLLCSAAATCAGDETLEDLWRAAAMHNPGMQSHWLESEAAGSEALAATAKLAPSASVRTGYTVRSSEPSFVGSQPALGLGAFRFPYAQQNAASFSATASVPIWTAGRLEDSAAAARSRHGASLEAAGWAQMRLRMAVAEAGVAVLRAKASATAAARLLRSAEAVSADTHQRATQRRATDQEALEARVEVLRARQRVVEAENAEHNALAALNTLLGRPLDHPSDLVEPYFPPLPGTLAELTEFALANRPDLTELCQQARAHASDASGWDAANLPQLTAEVGFDYEENRFQSPQGLATAGLFVDWNAFDGGRNRRLSDAASQRASALRAALRARQDEAALEVFRAWNARGEAASAERLADESLSLASEHYRSVMKRFEQGIAIEAEVAAAEANHVNALAELIYARTERILNQARIRLATGQL